MEKPNTKNTKRKIIEKTVHNILVVHSLAQEEQKYRPELIDPNNMYATSEQFALIEANIRALTRETAENIKQETQQKTEEIMNLNNPPNNRENIKREEIQLNTMNAIQEEITNTLLRKEKEELKPVEIAVEYLLKERIQSNTTNNQRQITDYIRN